MVLLLGSPKALFPSITCVPRTPKALNAKAQCLYAFGVLGGFQECTNELVTFVSRTPKALNAKAQRRAAHAGFRTNEINRTPAGFHMFPHCVTRYVPFDYLRVLIR
jgi:DNA mismatch repair protein MutH